MHDLSGRNGPLVAVNCGALPEHLVEAELFGYRKGAFSGAAEDRPGLIRSADRGTLFLDEVGELPLPAQASLLRVLQESEVMPLGATRPVKVDLRVLSATHRDLQSMVELAQFRADLLGRLSGFTLELPPLRERREDLGLIAGALLLRLFPDRAASLRLTPAAARALFRHSWPLNVRELEKCLGTGVALAGDEPVDLKHLPAVLHDPVAFAAPQLTPDDRRQADQIRALLREHGGNISAAAQAMGKARMQIQRWIKRYRIDVREFKH
jgi:transcriptional regulator with GAF, ATPase, and Fis domain